MAADNGGGRWQVNVGGGDDGGRRQCLQSDNGVVGVGVGVGAGVGSGTGSSAGVIKEQIGGEGGINQIDTTNLSK